MSATRSRFNQLIFLFSCNKKCLSSFAFLVTKQIKKKEKKRKRKKRERNEKKRRKSLYLQGNGNIDEVDKET